MNIADYDYELPEELIAQRPLEQRDESRLMVIDRSVPSIQHRQFRDVIEYIEPGDVLVLNDTRVIPSRLQAKKAETHGKVEVLLLERLNSTDWRCIVGGRNVGLGTRLDIANTEIDAEVIEQGLANQRTLRFSMPIDNVLDEIGQIPLPPYIHDALDDWERYQTVYNRHEGSAAAPTAGLHFSGDLLIALRDKGVRLAYVTLHVGLDTFQPIVEADYRQHPIHSEYAILSAANAQLINETKLAGHKVIAVGTTTARVLETANLLSAGCDPAQPEQAENLCPWRPVVAFSDYTRLFIYPGYRWRVVDALITNFHLPRTSLLLMVSSLAGQDSIRNAYAVAVQEKYRFYSFGDAMLIR
jgi:S-adenosylmethionine:tRNA ribosyltransferase-isomerase